MIPARLGSQRLERKNLRSFGGLTLLEHAIERCITYKLFDDIYVNSESLVFKKYADKYQISFYKRPKKLGNNFSTSEDFVADFFEKVDCTVLYQIHSITPLLYAEDIRKFVTFCRENSSYDTVLSCINDQIEVAFQNKPINFSFKSKSNSQDLLPMQRITWAATKWTKSKFLESRLGGNTGTYSGNIGLYPVSPFSGLAIKTIEDLRVARALRKVI